MIQVRCNQCDFTFEVDDESAGLSEYCPECGAENDVPAALVGEGIERTFAPATHLATKEKGRGFGGFLWWMTVLAALAGFVIACRLTLRPNWESEHLQSLSDAVSQGDSAMAAGDFKEAEKQYQLVATMVGERVIVSDYLRDLVGRAKRGAVDAEARIKAAPASAPSVASAAAATRGASPAEPGDSEEARMELAQRNTIRAFQRASEGFADFVRQHPFMNTDSLGRWSRRRYIVWDVSCELQSQAQPVQMNLGYTCSVRSTLPHDRQSDAMADSDFSVVQQTGVIHCQTSYVLRGNRWVVMGRQRDDEQTTGISLDNLYGLEQAAFATASK